MSTPVAISHFLILTRSSSTIHKCLSGDSLKDISIKRVTTFSTWILSCRLKRSTIKPENSSGG